MESNLEPPPTTINGNGFLSPPSSPFAEEYDFYIDDMSNCSTPYVSAPSSPGRFNTLVSSGFYYSAPASPMHFVLATAPARSSAAGGLIPTTSDASSNGSFEFDFSSRFENSAPLEIGSSMSSADELFLNGQIRPMKLCAHLQRPQQLPCLTLHESERANECENEDDENISFQMCSRDLRFRNSRSQRRRTRSLSPLRSSVPSNWYRADDIVSTPKKEGECEGGEREKDSGGTESETTTGSGSSSRCSSAGRSSKRWVFLKDFLRSKSEGRSNNKFWHNINISFSPAKEKREKLENANVEEKKAEKEVNVKKGSTRRSMRMHHHYAMNRAQTEQMRKRTYLPYRQGLLGCLGFNSKTYGAFHGFARAFNPVSSTSTPG